LPGVGVPDEPAYRRGQLSRRDVRDRGVLQDEPHAGAHGYPDIAERLGRAGVFECVRVLARKRGERTVDGTDDVGDRDLLSRTGK
jgi:hypothetical protein